MTKKIIIIVLLFCLALASVFLLPNQKAQAETQLDLWSLYLADPSRVTANVNPAQAPNVIDDNAGTSWHPIHTNDWWQMDLGSVYDVSRVTSTLACSYFRFYYSANGSSWSNIAFPCPLMELTFSPTQSMRYVKLVFTNPSPWGWEAVMELDVFVTGGGGSSTPPPTPTPSPSGGGTTPTPSGTGIDGGTTTMPTTTIINGTSLPYNPIVPTQPQTENFNIKIEVPNGGEEWWLGQRYEIKWRSTDIEKKIASIGLFLSTDNGKNYKYLIAKDLSNDGDNSWQIPFNDSLVTDEAKVLVAAISSNNQVLINDTSDNNFKIRSQKTEFLSVTRNNLFLLIIALILLLLASSAVLWSLILNFILNSFITSFLNRLSLLTAPTMGNKKGTGIVYDSYTKSPISGAVVRIFSAADSRLRETIITNKKGEFSFLLPRGNYYLDVTSTEYDFPSQNLLKKLKPDYFRSTATPPRKTQFTSGLKDNGYLNIYFGETISINHQDNPGQKYALNINIPLDKGGAFNVEGRVLHILRWVGNLLAKIKWPSLILGVIVSSISIWSDFNILNVIILDLFIILILDEVYHLVAKSRPFGLVFDQEKTAVELALVRFKGEDDKIKSTAISGRDGKFVAQVDPGDYNLLTKKNGFNENERQVVIKSVRQLEKLDIGLKKY